MVEQKSASSTQNIRLQDNEITWQDVQGLSWVFNDDTEITESFKTSFACA
jgi:hypothetical protein